MERSFNSEVLIIPGQEIDIRWHQEVELFLPNGATFRFLAHPGYPTISNVIENIQGIETYKLAVYLQALMDLF